jgi:UPF0755 protein
MVVFAVVALVLFEAALFQSANLFDKSKVKIVVPQGVSTYSVQKILEEQEVIKPRSSFAFAARILGLTKGIQAGEYEFSPSDTLFSILLKLKRGEVVVPVAKRVLVTFPEGTSIYKMGEILKKEGVSDHEKFKALVKEGVTEDLRERHWSIFKFIPSESLEGYLYPDSYWFFAEAEVPDLAEIMVSHFEEKVMPFWEKAKKDTKYNLHEIITLASIIEKEAADPKERPIISSVFHNRMDIKMALDSCSTIKYALDDPTPIVTYEQLEVDSPYNTYKNRGLPPGPICNPGLDSIKAAVYPADTDYLYFVSKRDGTHIFSKTFAEHQRANRKVNR